MDHPIDQLLEGLKKDIETGIYYYDETISRNQRKIALILLTQYIVFLGILANIILFDDVDGVSKNSAFMIVLGVVGIGLAKWKTGNLLELYSNAYVTSDIARVKDMVIAINSYLLYETQNTKTIISEAMERYEEVGKLREKRKYSLDRLESSIKVLWFSELLFITLGTLYGGFGEDILAFIHR